MNPITTLLFAIFREVFNYNLHENSQNILLSIFGLTKSRRNQLLKLCEKGLKFVK